MRWPTAWARWRACSWRARRWRCGCCGWIAGFRANAEPAGPRAGKIRRAAWVIRVPGGPSIAPVPAALFSDQSPIQA
ncbi:hypothetical protein [Lysobacter gummosus]|uniref:hypothetical protein n=1 Tax=Lysobacter gummosus TaxID=262324 RepID=UPI00363BB0AB